MINFGEISYCSLTLVSMAGHDVLAISLRALFYYLARHKDVKAKLRAELAILNESHPLPKNIPYSKLSKLTYL